jgi:hypothetical protein
MGKKLTLEGVARFILEVGNFEPKMYDLETEEELFTQTVAGNIEDINTKDINRIFFYTRRPLEHSQLMKLIEFARVNRYQFSVDAKRDEEGYPILEIYLKHVESKPSENEEPKQLVPTDFGKLVYRFAIDPVTANLLYANLKASFDVEATIDGFKKFLDAARLFGIKNEHFTDGSYSINALEYRQINDVPIENPVEFFSYFFSNEIKRQLNEFCPKEFHLAICKEIVKELSSVQ